MTKLRAGLVGFAVGVLSATVVACGPTKAACNTSTCIGCCDAQGTCQQGGAFDACGAGGLACQACQLGANCLGGVCSGGAGGGTGGSGGSGGGATGGGTGTLTTLDDFCQQAPVAICTFYTRCGFTSSQSGCEVFFSQSFGSSSCSDDEKAAVKDGRAAFDGARLKRCLDKVKTTAPCLLGGAPPDPDCEPLVNGLVAVNGTCFSDFECQGEAHCNESNLTCPGQCVAKIPIGMAAGSTDECVGDGYIVAGRCEAPVALNGSCAGGRRCASGTFCASGTQVCTAPQMRGQPCTSSSQCLGLACSNGTCGDYANVGQTCQTSSPSIPCKADLFCAGASTGVPGTCKAPANLGGVCGTPNDRCLPGLFCAPTDGGTGVCAAGKALGATCANIGDCLDPLFCDTNATPPRCADPKPNGATCSSSQECIGFCNGTTCASSGCKDPTP